MCQQTPARLARVVPAQVNINSCMHVAPPCGMLRACSLMYRGRQVHGLLLGPSQRCLLAGTTSENHLKNAAPFCGVVRVCSHFANLHLSSFGPCTSGQVCRCAVLPCAGAVQHDVQAGKD